jgi:hypothetical protein
MHKRRLRFESLETRQVLSASYTQLHWLSSELGEPQSVPSVTALVSSETPSVTAQPMAVASSTWDWLAGTRWYVPNDNLLAYVASSHLTGQFVVADQTLWHIIESNEGHIAGTGIVELSVGSAQNFSFAGVVTPDGQVRMEFDFDSGETPATGIGQMRFKDGAWYLEMQLVTGTNDTLMHWAYMAQETQGVTPSQPEVQNIVPNQAATQWRWLEGTHWLLHDPGLLGGSSSGVFQIDHYESGYFWGSGTSSKPFNVMGSVTPEGNLVMAVSYDGGAAQARTGFISNSAMHLRPYDSDFGSGSGSAWLIGGPAPNSRWLMSSVQGAVSSL